MRKRMRFAVAPIVALLVMGVAACGDDDDNGGGGGEAKTSTSETANIQYSGVEDKLAKSFPEPKPAKITVGWSNPLGANESLTATQKTAEAITKKLGGTFRALDAQGDPNKQLSDVEQLVAQKVDVMIVFPLDAKALNPALERAKKAGIPVIGQEVTPDGSDPGPLWTAQVIQRRDFQAYAQAKLAAQELPPGSEVGLLGFAVAVPSLEYFQDRQRYWLDKFGLKVAGDADNPSDDIAGGEKAMTQLLSEAPNIKGVVSYNEESATGAQAAARQAGKRDLVLIGANGGSLGFNSVRDGKITGTVQIQVPSFAKQLVWGAFDAVEGVKIPKTVLTTEPKVITKETIDQVPTWDEAARQEIAG